jgi:hypothetical protein
VGNSQRQLHVEIGKKAVDTSQHQLPTVMMKKPWKIKQVMPFVTADHAQEPTT